MDAEGRRGGTPGRPARCGTRPDLLVSLVDAVELVDEVHVPRRTAELTVGGGLEADLLLHPHRIANRVVFDSPQLVGGQPAPLRELLAGRSSSGGLSRLPT